MTLLGDSRETPTVLTPLPGVIYGGHPFMFVITLLCIAGFIGGLWFLTREVRGFVSALFDRSPQVGGDLDDHSDLYADSEPKPHARPRDRRTRRSARA